MCGLVSLAIGDIAGSLAAERRLDGGRRERLATTGPSVLSVEAGTARLRRGSLAGVLAATAASIDVVPFKPEPAVRPTGRTMAFRPRARILEGPDPQADPRARIVALTGALSNRNPPQRLTLEPGEAAERILDQLQQWGYR